MRDASGVEYGTLAAEVYELDKPIGHSFGDVEYYQQQLRNVGGRILEPAVGTGRMLIPLLKAGFEVEGYDTSPKMLEICRRHCREHGVAPILHRADMTSFINAARYGAVIVPAGSIGLLDGEDATRRALACFFACLQPAGRVILDVDVPSARRMTDPGRRSACLRRWQVGAMLWTLQEQHFEYDPATNQTTTWCRYEKRLAGALVATEVQVFRLQYWSVRAFTQLLAAGGFADVAVSQNYGADGVVPGGGGTWTFHAVRP